MNAWKFRPAVSGVTLDDAMTKVATVESQAALLSYLREHYGFWKPTDQNVTVEAYGYDDRIAWNTYLVCVAGKAALFADGPPPWASEPLGPA